jgi:hypothetical protein
LLLLLVVFVSTAPLLVISVVQQCPFLYRIELVAKKPTPILIIHASIHIFGTTPLIEKTKPKKLRNDIIPMIN